MFLVTFVIFISKISTINVFYFHSFAPPCILYFQQNPLYGTIKDNATERSVTGQYQVHKPCGCYHGTRPRISLLITLSERNAFITAPQAGQFRLSRNIRLIVDKTVGKRGRSYQIDQ
jgi:hypothetical protein